MLENNFARMSMKNALGPILFEKRKEEFMQSADPNILLFALERLKLNEEVLVITEETRGENDKKEFKKLPRLCDILGIPVKTLPEYLSNIEGIDIGFS